MTALGLAESQVVINSQKPAGATSDATLVLVLGNDYNTTWTGTTP